VSCPLLAVSPHLDDAVLACGGLLAEHPGARVVTVFAGCAGAEAMSTGWDRACGFGNAAQAMAARRQEDRAALLHLGARPRWLAFCDAQYDRPAPQEEIAAALAQELKRERPPRLAVPLGLFHSDHVLAADACLALFLQAGGGAEWLAYEDALYRRIPGLVQERLQALAALGIEAVAVPSVAAACLKRAAVQCYRSQLDALAGAGHEVQAEVAAPERYWSLRLAAHG